MIRPKKVAKGLDGCGWMGDSLRCWMVVGKLLINSSTSHEKKTFNNSDICLPGIMSPMMEIDYTLLLASGKTSVWHI